MRKCTRVKRGDPAQSMRTNHTNQYEIQVQNNLGQALSMLSVPSMQGLLNGIYLQKLAVIIETTLG
jgi:hypothetical protein